jgi:RNA polymerase sigma-70 factor (ECF subfamily)
MGSLTGALPFPAFGCKVRADSRVDYQNTSEGALVQRAQAGEETAFREIVERYQSKVFSIIHGVVRQRNDVEDIAQQVFAKVYVSIKSFDFRSSLITWIYKITVNECFDYLRKRKVRKLVYESDLSEDEVRRVDNSEPSTSRQVPIDTTLARRDYLLRLLTRVSEEERMLLMLKEVEGYSVEELAEKTGMNENTIKVKLFRARQKLVKAAQRLDRAPGLVAG